MVKQIPPLEIFPPADDILPAGVDRRPWYRSRRFIIFSVVFLCSAGLGLSYVYHRPAQYRSTATLLTVTPTAIDQHSGEADVQHVVIQQHVLTGPEILAETLLRLDATLQRLSDVPSVTLKSRLSLADLRRMLGVQPVAGTNLVELSAEGQDPYILPLLINTWIDVYLDARAKQVEQNTGTTILSLRRELQDLNSKITIKRSELEGFRRIYDITSLGRDENEVLARLKGLNASLNKAQEEEVKAKAHLDAVRQAIAMGQPVVPDQDKRSMQLLELRLQQLREKLAEFDRRYTRDYLAKQPALKVIPEQIQELEAEIRKKRSRGQRIVAAEAQQDYAAAKQTVRAIRKQLDEHKQQAAEFSSRFAEHEALLKELEGLEELSRLTQERLVQIETRDAVKYPQVKVVERAFLPERPFAPDYTRDAIIAVAGAVLFSLFWVWVVDYLTRREQPQTSVNLTGIHMYQNPPGEMLGGRQHVQALQQQYTPTALESPSLQEISSIDLGRLFSAANIQGKQLIAMLCNGLTLDEAAALQSEQIDFATARITVGSSRLRSIPMHAVSLRLLREASPCPAWNLGQPVASGDLAAMLLCAAVDAGLTDPEHYDADALRHTYIVFLVRQGLCLADLEAIVGYLPPTVLAGYHVYSPSSPGIGIDEVELLLHPALAGFV